MRHGQFGSTKRRYLVAGALALTNCSDPAVGATDTAECTPEDSVPDAEIVGETVDVRLFDLHPNDLCGANLRVMQSHAQWVANAWGTTAPHIEYDLFDSKMHPCWPCPGFAGACSGPGSVNTTRAPDRHEIAHAARGVICSALLEEGWATLYANPFEVGAIAGNLNDAMASVEETGYLAGEYYPFAARFVAFLLDTHGIETVVQLCSIPFASRTELNAALNQVLGKTLDEVQQELDEYPATTLGQLRQDQACEDTASALTVPASWTMSLDCGNVNVEGKRDVRVWTGALVEIPEALPHSFVFSAPDDVYLQVELRNCTAEGMASIFYDNSLVLVRANQPGGLIEYDITPGVYVVRVMADAEALAVNPNLEIGATVEQWP